MHSKSLSLNYTSHLSISVLATDIPLEASPKGKIRVPMGHRFPWALECCVFSPTHLCTKR